MDWDISFGRKKQASCILPGYHGELRNEVGSIVTIRPGVRVCLERVEFSLRWNQLTPEEKKQVKTRYGQDAKQKYHQYTRISLKRLLWTQTLFPTVDW